MLLPEDDAPLGAVKRPPGADAPLQGTADADADLGMAPPDLVENGEERRHALHANFPPKPRRSPRLTHGNGGPGRQRVPPGPARPPQWRERCASRSRP